MKEILSYWDLSLGLISILFGFLKWKKFLKIKKKDDYIRIKNQNWQWKLSYSRYLDNRLEQLICNLFIVFGVFFIYNRIKGNIPNIYTFIKDIIVYHQL